MKVLFVCSGNAHRSPLAEALLRKLRPDLEVNSAGVNPTIPISEEAKKYLARENAERLLKKAPEDLDTKRLREYDLIIVMEQVHKEVVLSKCPECDERIVVWNVEDPYFLSPQRAEKIYELIREKVADLAKSL